MKPGVLQSMGSQKVGYNLATEQHLPKNKIKFASSEAHFNNFHELILLNHFSVFFLSNYMFLNHAFTFNIYGKKSHLLT